MYKTILELTKAAEKNNSMVGAFNAHNLEMIPDMIRGAKEMNAPIIIQVNIGTGTYIGYDVIVAIVKTLAKKESIDIALHLDHARDFTEIKKAIKAGFNSVMYDGSHLSLKENTKNTREVVNYAHRYGVAVEGEIGSIGGVEDGIVTNNKDEMYTDPKEAKQFVIESGCDILAVAIGTNHGQYTSKAELNIPLLDKIRKEVDIPLVIHGGTGVKESDYPKLIDGGVRKFNVGTELLVNWTKVAKNNFATTELNRSLRYNLIPANTAVKEIIKHKISLFQGVKKEYE